MVSGILAILGIALAILVVLAALPLDLRFAASIGDPKGTLQGSPRLGWAFGLFTHEMKRSRRQRDPDSKGHSLAGKRRTRSARLRVSRLVANPAAWERMSYLLGRLLHSIEWRTFRLDGRFGLDDPADTGYLWGALAPFAATLLPCNGTVTIMPAFHGQEAVFHTEGILRVYPPVLLWIALRFVAAPSTWRAFRPAFGRRHRPRAHQGGYLGDDQNGN